MWKGTAFLLEAVFFATPSPGQLDILTVREAQKIVASIPDVAAARQAGKCPQLSSAYSGADRLDFQVRLNCGSSAGQLLNNYSVNRRTGAVRLWGDDPLPVADRAGEGLAANLIDQARARVLSNQEAACVALTAAKSLPDWEGPDAIVSVKPTGKVNGDVLGFTALRHDLDRSADGGRSLTVSLNTARVRDDQTGLYLMSERLGTITAKILDLRAPPLLTTVDVLSIGFRVPALASTARGGCRLWSGGSFWLDEIQVSVNCAERVADNAPVIAVNVQNGQITDASTAKAIESPDASRLAKDLLAARQRQKAALKKEVDTICAH